MAEDENKLKEQQKNAGNTASSSADIEFEEIIEDLGATQNQKPETKSSNIDYIKLERIKRELYADDFDLEKINKSVAQMHLEEEPYVGTSNGSLTSRSERIAEKNRQLMEEIYKYGRQKTQALQLKAKEKLNVVLTVILFLLLVAVLTLGIFLYLQRVTRFDEDFIRVSVSMTNKEIFYETEVEGQLIPKSVSPGDKFNLNIIARNSRSIIGDNIDEEWTSIYVRFKIVLIIDGVEHNDFIIIEPNPELWERYNKEIEDQYLTGEGIPHPVVMEDDGYYYCRKILAPNEQVTVIEWLRFSEQRITELVGGNRAVLQVNIEALESIPNIIKNREIWVNAPQHWVLYMTQDEQLPNEEEMPERPDTVNSTWVIVFISVAVVLCGGIVYVTTRKKKDKAKIADMNRTINRRNE